MGYLMRKIALAATTALVAQGLLISSAPLAAADISVPAAQLSDAQSTCNSLLKPNSNSGFVTAPINGRAVLVNHSQTEELISGPTLIGDPVYSNISFEDFSVNGHAGNIWATPTAHTRTWSDSVSVFRIHIEDTYNYTFDCKVWKTITNKSGTKEVVPPDQQSYGHTTSTWIVTTEYDEERHTGPVSETGSWPQGDSTLVCNRPQGIWTQQNRFTGECSDDAYVAAGGDLVDLLNGNSGGNGGGSGSGGSNSGGGGNGGGNGGGGKPKG